MLQKKKKIKKTNNLDINLRDTHLCDVVDETGWSMGEKMWNLDFPLLVGLNLTGQISDLSTWMKHPSFGKHANKFRASAINFDVWQYILYMAVTTNSMK